MLVQIDWSLGRFGDRRLDKGGRRSSNAWLRARMSACGGWQEASRAREVRFNRFLGNTKVTTARVIESWSEGTAAAAGRPPCAGDPGYQRDQLSHTTAQRRRGLGEIGHGNTRGRVAAPDAGGRRRERQLPWTVERRGLDPQGPAHRARTISATCSDKESQRWIATALAAKPLLAKAAMVTMLGDRESDIFALYASCREEQLPCHCPQHARSQAGGWFRPVCGQRSHDRHRTAGHRAACAGTAD